MSVTPISLAELRALAVAAAKASHDGNWAVRKHWMSDEWGWVYTASAPIRFNKGDGLPTLLPYNGEPVLVSRGSGAKRRDNHVNRFIAAACPAKILELLDLIETLRRT